MPQAYSLVLLHCLYSTGKATRARSTGTSCTSAQCLLKHSMQARPSWRTARKRLGEVIDQLNAHNIVAVPGTKLRWGLPNLEIEALERTVLQKYFALTFLGVQRESLLRVRNNIRSDLTLVSAEWKLCRGITCSPSSILLPKCTTSHARDLRNARSLRKHLMPHSHCRTSPPQNVSSWSRCTHRSTRGTG